MIKRIAITGPESTGKSTLARQLAEHYDTLWVPEYAREYIEELDSPYTYEDVEQIARIQMQREAQALSKAKRILFSDTELLVIKIWMEHSFERIPAWLEEEISDGKYDFYLLCDIDLPWQPDPQREHPDLRKYFFDLYEGELRSRGFDYAVVNGRHEDRLENAIKAIKDKLCF